MRGLLAELQRRKVFRAAVTYAASAWAILQMADLFFPMLGLPEWSMAFILLLCAGGFPIAMGLAWFFDFSSQGLTPTQDLPASTDPRNPSIWQAVKALLITALVVTVGYLYYDRLFEPASIAVLPFEDLSAKGENKFFSDGVAEEIRNALTQVEGIQVAARTSSFSVRGGRDTAVEIGKKLGVAALLEGSVRIVGNSVRVNTKLIDTRTGFPLWSKDYNEKLEDIFSLQDDIARKVLYAILPLITSVERVPSGPTTNEIGAYNEYLKGRALLREPSTDKSIEAAKEHFRQAMDIDLTYAEAWAGLCEALLADFRHNNRSNLDTLKKGKQTCNHALSLSSPQALAPSKSKAVSLDVYLAKGILYREEGDLSLEYEDYYAESLDALLKARKLSPNSSRVMVELGATYSALAARSSDASKLKKAKEYLGKAERILLHAIDVDGERWDTFQALANFYYDHGDFPQAIRFYHRAWEANPGATDALINQGSALDWMGEKAEAESKWLLAEQQAQATENAGALGFIYLSLGGLYYYKDEPDKALQAYLSAAGYSIEAHIIQGRIAESYRALGNKERAPGNYPAMEQCQRRLENIQQYRNDQNAGPDDYMANELRHYANAIKTAEDALKENPGNRDTLGLLAIYHGFSGDSDKVKHYHDEIEELGKVLEQHGKQVIQERDEHYFRALAHWSICDNDNAFKHIGEAWKVGSMHYILSNDPDLEQLRRSDPGRWDEIVASQGD